MSAPRPRRHVARPSLGREPIHVGAAARLGWSRAAVRHAIARGDLDRVRRGVLAAAPDAEDAFARRGAEIAHLRAAQAATVTCPRAVISHVPAALAVGMPAFGRIDRPCLTVPAGTALRNLAGIHLHRATLQAEDVVADGRYRLTTPTRTIMNVAREHGVAAGVAAADWALHEGLVGRDELAAGYERCARWPGRKSARITLALADGLAESVLESVSRVLMAAHGLPAPRLQVEICDEYGRFLGRSDFYWDEFGVVGEADGAAKYRAGAQVIVAERNRHADFETAGLMVVRWGWPDLFAFDSVVHRLRTAFARGARRGSPLRRWGLVSR
jgi:hypothetical protein